MTSAAARTVVRTARPSSSVTTTSPSGRHQLRKTATRSTSLVSGHRGEPTLGDAPVPVAAEKLVLGVGAADGDDRLGGHDTQRTQICHDRP